MLHKCYAASLPFDACVSAVSYEWCRSKVLKHALLRILSKWENFIIAARHLANTVLVQRRYSTDCLFRKVSFHSSNFETNMSQRSLDFWEGTYVLYKSVALSVGEITHGSIRPFIFLRDNGHRSFQRRPCTIREKSGVSDQTTSATT